MDSIPGGPEPRSCLILGSGRSGTSMVAGCLRNAGYFMGSDLIPPTAGNPKGYFEDRGINAINEEILAPLVAPRPRFFGRWFFHDRPLRNQRWLARIPLGHDIPCPGSTRAAIRELVRRPPFCFKDPRFSYTLDAWRPLLPPAVFLCVFRHPAATAESILRECRTERYLRHLSISFRQAVEVWRLMYCHILEIHSKSGEWLFLHYDQVLENVGAERIETFLRASIDRDFPERGLGRSVNRRGVGKATMAVYQDLCERAGHTEHS